MKDDSSQALERIWQVVASIPRGQVETYGGVAARAGLPRRARLVGHALRKAPQSLGLPWHRVINARGAISLPPGSPAYALQCRRLAAEGVEVVNGVIDLTRFRPADDLDALLWRPPG